MPSKAATLEVLRKQREELGKKIKESEVRKRQMFVKFFEDNFHEVQSLRKLIDVVQTSAAVDERMVTAMLNLASKCHALHYRKCLELTLDGFDTSVIFPYYDLHNQVLNGGTVFFSEEFLVPESDPQDMAKFVLSLTGYEYSEVKVGRKIRIHAKKTYSAYERGLADYYAEYVRAKQVFVTDEAKKLAFSELVSFVAKNQSRIADIWEYVCYDTNVLKKRDYSGGAESVLETNIQSV